VSERYVVLTGGVGGAKLCLGLAQILSPREVVFGVNVGDDFEHLGLQICPDLDTLTYALAHLTNPETGWGRRGESWHFIETVRSLGGEDWFNLGDRDLALHVLRTAQLRGGRTLTEVTATLSQALGITHTVLPVSDDPVRTVIQTPEGPLAFQHYFVRERCVPAVTGFSFAGADAARLNPRLREWLHAPDLAGVILAPSNPFVSIDPVLAVPGVRECLRSLEVPVVAVSPIVSGMAIKGPTAKMMDELGVPRSALAVASHYEDFLDGFILDSSDEGLLDELGARGLPAIATPSVMLTLDDKVALASSTVSFIRQLRAS
jgi:LPPG:FO 2-phospho-L-lactate transferase